MDISETRLFGGRYQVVELLKSDRSGDHFLANDLLGGTSAIIRLVKLSSISAAMRIRLEREVKELGELQSPWLTGKLEIGEDDDLLYVVRPFVHGISLRDRLANSRLSYHEAITLGQCLFSALKLAHERRVFHHCIRPSNIIVDEQIPLKTAVLSDFSLGMLSNAGELAAEESVEAAHYLSPESAGALDHDIGETSDLYSAGIVLFECLAGHPPFRGDKVGSILYQHMTASVPELRSMGVDLPRALDELIQRLLRKDPRDRYQTAQAVSLDLESILRCGEENSTFVVGSHDRRPTLTEPALVGREAELNLIEEQIQQVFAGDSRLVYLESESGGGKTRLLKEITLRGVKAGMRVFRSQGLEQAGQKPFQILSPIVEQVTAEARSNPPFAKRLSECMGGQNDVLATVFPELAHLLGGKVAEESSPQVFAENQTIQALASLLRALGTPEQPALVIFDDCQWADDLTCKLLRWQQTQSNDDPSHVLLVGAFRSEDVTAAHLLRGFEPSAHIRLPAFTGDEIRQMIESMAGKLPEVAIKLISQFAEGNPFMASAVLRGMVESGALIADADGWQVDPRAMADLSSSSRAANFLARRLTLLPVETIQLLSTAAILGKQFDLTTVTSLSGQSLPQAVAALEEARRRHLVWSSEDGQTSTFVHDRIRSALLDRLTFGQFAELHRRAAMYFEQNAPERIADIAYHFDAAGDSLSALPYALQAAERARAQHVLDVAEQQYRIAERCDSISDASVRFRIAEGLGDVLMLRGKYALAGELFESAAALAEGSYAKAQICGKIGELALKRGDMQGAARAIEKGLQFLHRKIPQKPFSCTIRFLWHFSLYLMHSMVPAWLRRRGKKTAEKEVLLQLHLLSRLGYVYWFSRGRMQTFLVHFSALNLAERYTPSSEMAQIYSDHAVAMTLLGKFARGIRFARKSLEIRRSLGDVWGQGQSLSFYGVVLYAASRYRECIEKCREAVALLERTGDMWEVHIARYQIGASFYRLGELRAAIEEARQSHNSGVELGDDQAAGINLDVWARASGGKTPPDALRKAVEKKRVDVQAAAQVSLAQGVQLTESGRHEEAVSVLEKALADSDCFIGLMSAYVMPLLPWLATALRRQAESPQILTSVKRDALLARAEAAARRAVRHARRFRNDLPHALREYALIMSMTGRTGSVRRLLEKSMAIALQQDAKYEYAQTMLAYGQLGLELDWKDAESRIAEAQSLLADIVVSEDGESEDAAASLKSASLSLYDRFDTVLVSGRKIASALTGAAIFEEARRAALRLLRAEHCLVLQILGEGDNCRLIPVTGRTEGKFDEALVRKALKANKAIAHDGQSASRAGENQGLVDKQSILCVPLNVRGRAVACLYADHRHIQNLFGPNEVRLADFIATIAGAALENAEGFKLLQQLNATLEQRVVERTAAAESRSRELALSNQELERVASELLQTQEQLRIAMQAAHAANHAKSRFLATMSHEIRTPMNGIIGMTELALGTSLTEQQRSYLNTLKDSAHLLLEIINDILDFSKIEAGKMELETIPCNIRKIVHDVARLLAVSASKKDLELVCRIAADVPAEVLGDSKRLRQVIVNLLGNAIKFTERGEVLIRVEMAERIENKVQLRFTVRDTGIGIPEDKIGHIFESFRQSDSSMTRRFGGTGLGLAISAQLAELMGGCITVESKFGVGSAFHFLASFQLPAESENSAAKLPVLSPAEALVVSGNQNVREYCGEILTNAGMRVQLIDNHESAREAVLAANAAAHENQISSLLVIDAGQKRAEGFDFLESLNHGEIVGWRVIVLTPAGLVDGIERCQKLGIEHCITKPVKADELLETVQATLDSCSVDVVVPTVSDPQKGRVLRVLVADDSPVNQEVASGLLELRGHAVQVVDNGRDAVEAFRTQAFDVILMDVEMPELDGLSAASMIRSFEKDGSRRVPILAMTAHILNSAHQQCLDAGMDGYISKPIQPEELYQALETYCPLPALVN